MHYNTARSFAFKILTILCNNSFYQWHNCIILRAWSQYLFILWNVICKYRRRVVFFLFYFLSLPFSYNFVPKDMSQILFNNSTIWFFFPKIYKVCMFNTHSETCVLVILFWFLIFWIVPPYSCVDNHRSLEGICYVLL